MDIKEVVKDREWQKLRENLKGTWTSESNAKKNLLKLKRYLLRGKGKAELRYRRVHNYLNALRGIDDKYPDIKKMRKKVREVRQRKGW